MIVTLDGIDIHITKKKIKNTHLRVRRSDGKVSLSTPYFVSNDYITKYLSSKLFWIKKQINKFANMPQTPEMQYKTGESIHLFGQKYNLVVIDSFKQGIEKNDDTILLFSQPNSTVDKRKIILYKYYREQLELIIPQIMQKWQKVTNFFCSSWRLRDMKTRWGSYSTKTKNILLNVQLAKMPLNYIEYVVLHELSHSVVPNHSKDFTTILDKYMPSWRIIRKQLNNFSA